MAELLSVRGLETQFKTREGMVHAVNGVSFDSTLVVEQEDFFSLIDYRRKYEVYANNVGLIQKYYKNLVINGFDTLNVKSGDELFYNCIGFGFQ